MNTRKRLVLVWYLGSVTMSLPFRNACGFTASTIFRSLTNSPSLPAFAPTNLPSTTMSASLKSPTKVFPLFSAQKGHAEPAPEKTRPPKRASKAENARRMLRTSIKERRELPGLDSNQDNQGVPHPFGSRNPAKIRVLFYLTCEPLRGLSRKCSAVKQYLTPASARGQIGTDFFPRVLPAPFISRPGDRHDQERIRRRV